MSGKRTLEVKPHDFGASERTTLIDLYPSFPVPVWVGPSERNPVRRKASFDLMGHMFSFCWAFVPMGFRSSGMALCSVLPTDCNEIY